MTTGFMLTFLRAYVTVIWSSKLMLILRRFPSCQTTGATRPTRRERGKAVGSAESRAWRKRGNTVQLKVVEGQMATEWSSTRTTYATRGIETRLQGKGKDRAVEVQGTENLRGNDQSLERGSLKIEEGITVLTAPDPDSTIDEPRSLCYDHATLARRSGLLKQDSCSCFL
jgi:hypothetical protein